MKLIPKRSHHLLRTLAVILVLLAIPIVPFALVVSAGHDPFEWMATHVEGEPWAAAIFFLLLCADVFMPVPASLVALGSGKASGALAGGLLNLTAFTMSHLIGFGVARRWGRPVVARFIGQGAVERSDGAWNTASVVGLILTRPVPLLAEVFSMNAGLSKCTLRQFAVIVTLANVPHSFLYGWAGSRVQGVESLVALVALGAGVPTVIYLAWAAWNARSARNK